VKKKHASLAGTLAREGIRAAMGLGSLRNGGLFAAGTKHAKFTSRWKAPKGCALRKLTVDGLPMELLEIDSGRSDKVILQFHGGAYLMGLMDQYRRLALRYARLGGGVSVLSVDYRIAPQYQFPAALEDALAAWNWLLGHGYRADNIIVVGDSAGGNLALALALKLRDGGGALPRALVLMSPWADMSGAGESRVFNCEKDPMFGTRSGDKHISGNPYAGSADLRDPHLSPVYAEFSRYPPMLIQVGDWEMLLSDARTVAQKAGEAGVEVTCTEYAGMFHVFQMFGGLLPESRQAWREAGEFIRKSFAG
jgi:epsilon-lactone hydrolase